MGAHQRPAVAYDPLHGVWMISTLAIDASVSGAAVLTSRSTDGGLTWGEPVETSVSSGTFYDKNWMTCDTWVQSPHYGNCYQEWDDSRLTMSTSTDGALTWAAPKFPGNNGIGGQPVVQPNGNVIVPYEGGAGIRSFRSIDGGNTWQPSVAVATVSSHGVAGQPHLAAASAEVAGDGKVTSPGRTAASARAARRTTSSTAPRRTASPGRPSSGCRSTRRIAASTTSSPGLQLIARHPGTARGWRSATTTTRSPPAARARAS